MYVVSCFFVYGCQYQCNRLPGKARLSKDLLFVEWEVTPYWITLTTKPYNSLFRWSIQLAMGNLTSYDNESAMDEWNFHWATRLLIGFLTYEYSVLEECNTAAQYYPYWMSVTSAHSYSLQISNKYLHNARRGTSENSDLKWTIDWTVHRHYSAETRSHI